MSKTKTQDQEQQQQATLDPALTQEPTAVATAPKSSQAMTQYEETGFEGLTATDFLIPFLAILQKNRPQVEEGHAKYIPGAKAGMFLNTVTNEVFDGKVGVTVIPVMVVHSYLEWIPRDDGGGLQGVYDYNDPECVKISTAAGRKFGKLKINDNNDLVETYNVFAIQVLPDGGTKKIVLGFSSSQIGEFKRWMTNASEQTKVRPDGSKGSRPLWSHRYRLSTVFAQNKKGTWYKFHAAFDGANADAARYDEADPLQREAKDFLALLREGNAKADYSSAQQDTTAEEPEYAM